MVHLFLNVMCVILPASNALDNAGFISALETSLNKSIFSPSSGKRIHYASPPSTPVICLNATVRNVFKAIRKCFKCFNFSPKSSNLVWRKHLQVRIKTTNQTKLLIRGRSDFKEPREIKKFLSFGSGR